jgi:NADPH2 dehydrogenase
MADPIPTFTYFVKQLAEKHPSLAYIHAIEPRVLNGYIDRVVPEGEVCNSRRVSKRYD